MDHPEPERHQSRISVLLRLESTSRFRFIGTIKIFADSIAFPDDPEFRPEEIHPRDEVARLVQDVDLCLRLWKSEVAEQNPASGLGDALTFAIGQFDGFSSSLDAGTARSSTERLIQRALGDQLRIQSGISHHCSDIGVAHSRYINDRPFRTRGQDPINRDDFIRGDRTQVMPHPAG